MHHQLHPVEKDVLKIEFLYILHHLPTTWISPECPYLVLIGIRLREKSESPQHSVKWKSINLATCHTSSSPRRHHLVEWSDGHCHWMPIWDHSMTPATMVAIPLTWGFGWWFSKGYFWFVGFRESAMMKAIFCGSFEIFPKESSSENNNALRPEQWQGRLSSSHWTCLLIDFSVSLLLFFIPGETD